MNEKKIVIRGDQTGLPQVRFGRFLQRVRQKLGLGDAISTLELTGRLQLVESVEPHSADDHYLLSERLAGFQTTVAAGGAGTFGTLAIVNPEDSGHMLVMQYAGLAEPPGGGFIGFQTEAYIAANLTAVVGGGSIFKDLRNLPAGGAIDPIDEGLVGKAYAQAVAAGFAVNFRAIPPSVSKLNAVVMPGFGCIIRAVTANVAASLSLEWLERRVQEGEVDLNRSA